jgi:hypothetical protein
VRPIAKVRYRTGSYLRFTQLDDRVDGGLREPECLSCHTTGYQYHNGYDEQHRTAKLSGVQCEACHGYGSEHSRDGKYATVARESCLECHDLQNSHHADDGYEFDYATYWEKIKH